MQREDSVAPQAQSRFVAHFDMLGIAALTKRDPDLAWDCLSRLSQARWECLHSPIERTDTKELIVDRTHALIFSDTVVAFSRGDTPNDALALVVLTNELFMRSLHYCIPLRGGIAHGRFTFDLNENLFSGPALVDAYALGEGSQWIGIVVDDHTANALKSTPVRVGEDMIVPWQVEVAGLGACHRMAVSWPRTHRSTFQGTLPLTAEAFYEPLARGFGPWALLPPEVRRKYENTVSFFNAQVTSATVDEECRQRAGVKGSP
jgi:hypothetical protein